MASYIGVTHAQESGTRTFYQKLVLSGTQLYLAPKISIHVTKIVRFDLSVVFSAGVYFFSVMFVVEISCIRNLHKLPSNF